MNVLRSTRDRDEGVAIGHSIFLSVLILLGFLSFSWAGLILRPEYIDSSNTLRGAGFSLAVLVLFGRKFWPVILIGATISHLAFDLAFKGVSFDAGVLVSASVMALAATAEALIGVTTVKILCGSPMKFRGWRHFFVCLFVIGPLISVILPTVGTIVAYMHGSGDPMVLTVNWVLWWVGDMLGAAGALFFALLWPSKRPSTVFWRGRPVPRFDIPSLSYVAVALLATFASWNLMKAAALNYNRAQFQALVQDDARALTSRIHSDVFGLDVGAGLFAASDHVSLPEWQAFVGSLNLPQHISGVTGIGFVQPVKDTQLDAFLKQAAVDGVQNLQVAPAPAGREMFIIKYIEPLSQNRAALGLDLASEPNRRNAAIAARDSGLTQITKSITLVQAPMKGPSFLLLKPIYKPGMPVRSVAERQAAFRGWVYAPFVGEQLLDHLTSRQDASLQVHIYDGARADPINLIATNGPPQPFHASFHAAQTISVLGREWLVTWESTPAFEAGLSSRGTASVLYGGLGMTLMLTMFLLSRRGREDRIQETVTQRTAELTQQVMQNASIINSAVVTIALLDQDGNILSINSALERLFETTSDEMYGKPFANLLSGQMVEYFARSDEAEKVFNYRGEIEVVLKSGAWIALDVGVNAWSTEEGLLRYTVVMRDITDRRRIENQLRETQHRLEVALTGAQIGVFDIDVHTGHSIVSATWKVLMGLDPELDNDVQQEWKSRVHPDDRMMIAEADKACIEGRAERSTTEYRIKAPDGSWRWMRSDAVAVARDKHGVALRLVGIQADITERVKDKEDLRASEAQFRSAIEDAPVGMAIVDTNGKFLQVNQSLAYFAGVSQSQLMTESFLRMTHPDDRGAVMNEISRLLAGQVKSFHKETRYINSNGTVIWGLLSVAIVRDSRDRPRSFVVQVQDLTEMRKADLLKRQFVSTISHELRTPLTSINGAISLVLNAMKGDVSEKARRLLSIAQTNCDRLILLVNDILDIEKNAAGELQFYPVQAEITKMINDAVAANAPFAAQYDVAYDFNSPEGAMSVSVDVNRFQQVMTNLLSNAAKFSTRGSRVEIAVRRVKAGILISVTNQGSGIASDFSPKVFAPFSQQDSSETRANGGTGLGLHICRLIVERMGGTIGFDSVPNQSTTFWFTVPAEGSVEADRVA